LNFSWISRKDRELRHIINKSNLKLRKECANSAINKYQMKTRKTTIKP
jgi:hypothetical protein